MEDLFIFMITFVIVFVVYLVLYVIRRKQGKLREMKELGILAARFDLRKSDMDYNKLGLLFALINSLIISITGTICTMNTFSLVWQLLIAFVVLMCLIILSYTIVGKVLRKKEEKNNEHKRNRK